MILMNESLTKILIIDDELLLRNGIKYLCNWEEYGFTIIGEASNGLEGLQLIESLRPDIVITDILMSVMNGIELTKEIKEQYPWIHIIILSGYDDFNYVKSLFKLGIADYLLKPTMEKEELLTLLNRLKSNTSALSTTTYHPSASQTLKELIHGTGFDHNTALQRFHDAHTPFDNDSMYIFLCGSLFGNKTFFAFEKQIFLTLSKYPGCYRRVSCISDQGNLCILLQLRYSELNIEPDYLDSVVSNLEKVIESTIIFSMSKPFTTLSEVAKHYQTNSELLKYRFYFPEKHFIDFRDIKTHAVEFPKEAFNKTLDPLDLASASSTLSQYLKTTVRFPSVDVFTMKKQIENALYALIQALTSAGFDTTSVNIEKIRFFKLIDESENYQILEKVLLEFFQLLESLVENETQNRELDLFYQIQNYISENCKQELKLSDIAQTFHLNYTYLSTLFFQKTNEHFPDYLNKIRIETAKHILQTRKTSIQCVSEQVGFINQGYFSKIFKKYVGISPKEYQKIYQKNSKKI